MNYLKCILINYFMSLFDAKINTDCVVEKLEIEDEKTKIRLMELGLIFGTKVRVKNKSLLKKTLLVIFNNSCFTLQDVFAKKIMVKYV